MKHIENLTFLGVQNNNRVCFHLILPYTKVHYNRIIWFSKFSIIDKLKLIKCFRKLSPQILQKYKFPRNIFWLKYASTSVCVQKLEICGVCVQKASIMPSKLDL